MKQWIISTLLVIGPVMSYAGGADSHTEAQFHGSKVNTEELKSWYAKKNQMTILDARSKPYFDGALLPDAQWIPFDAPENELTAAIPSKDSLVVVYCAGPGCPASDWLSARLVKLGYTNVYEYPEGIVGWAKAGNATVNKK